MFQAIQCSAVNSSLWQSVPDVKRLLEKWALETFACSLPVVPLTSRGTDTS